MRLSFTLTSCVLALLPRLLYAEHSLDVLLVVLVLLRDVTAKSTAFAKLHTAVLAYEKAALHCIFEVLETLRTIHDLSD